MASFREIDRIELIAEIIQKIERRIGKTTFNDFAEDDDEIDLTAYRLAAIGEECGKLSSETKNAYSDIPWRQISAMRNIVVHEYRSINPRRIWDTAILELGIIKHFCSEYVRVHK